MVWEVTAVEREGSRVWVTEVEANVAMSASGTEEEVGWRENSGRGRDV